MQAQRSNSNKIIKLFNKIIIYSKSSIRNIQITKLLTATRFGVKIYYRQLHNQIKQTLIQTGTETYY